MFISYDSILVSKSYLKYKKVKYILLKIKKFIFYLVSHNCAKV